MYDTLVDCKVLQKNQLHSDWCSIDCRAALTDLQHGWSAYRQAHIPGSVFADLATDLSGPIEPGRTGRHPLPARDALAATFCRLGITAQTQVVAYDAGNGAFAARLWWLLRWLGHAQVAVLDGGLAAWVAAGYPVESGQVTRTVRQFATRSPLTRTATTHDIQACAEPMLLLDARAQARFRGEVEPIDPVAGHIPGAVCLPFEGNLDSTGRFLDRAALRSRFEGQVRDGHLTVCYCGSGVTACHNILAMRHAGLGEAALYAGSFSEWITDPTRPVEQ
jgi:thiosulfate/3-mercaptopyruvate sulfurtransferase